ncbi:MAG: phage major capsid protein [Hyphomicrobiaceae bacterium]
MEDASLETKSADLTDVNAAFDSFMRSFEQYKEENDRRLAEIEQRGAPDPLTVEKIARIDRRLDELQLKTMRRPIGGLEQHAGAPNQTKAAFESYVRRGDASGFVALEAKALSAGTGSDGGYLVPAETEAAVNRALKAISPIRAIASVRQVSGSVYKKPFAVAGASTGWVAETAARPETNAPTLDELSFPTMELYAMPAATQTLLDDSAVNIDEWIAEEVRLAFAVQEGQAFVTGDGTAKPKGFLAYTAVANGSWSHGNIGFIATGVSGGFPAGSPSDKLIDLIYAVKAGYRANGSFVMNRSAQAAVRKLKDGDGAYLWHPSSQPGQPPTLMGFPVVESEDMPDIAADSLSIAFGDFQRGYLIVDRIGISVLRDPYSAKPYVLFYTTKRVGGGVQDFEAIKLLKFAS